jgi:hypothetical protein
LVNLKSFVLLTATILDQSYAPLVGLKNLRHLDLSHPRDTAEAATLVASLPNLQSGNVLEGR